MRLLRDLREATRLLILLETSTRHHAVQRTIAEALGITVQGASEYLRSMEEDGLVQVTEGEYRPTIEGIRILHERFRELRDFVDRAGKELSIIDVTAAIAGGRIEQGDSVGLFMDRGDLVAYPSRNSPSRGQAVSRAERGGRCRRARRDRDRAADAAAARERRIRSRCRRRHRRTPRRDAV